MILGIHESICGLKIFSGHIKSIRSHFLNPLKLFSFNATHDFITVQLDKIKLKNQIKGFPTVRFINNGRDISEFMDERNSDNLIKFTNDNIKKMKKRVKSKKKLSRRKKRKSIRKKN